MDTHDTSISDSRARPSAADPAPTSSSSEYRPEFFGPAGWSLNDEMSAALARNWWVVALRGVFAILFGIVALLMPGVTNEMTKRREARHWGGLTAVVLGLGVFILFPTLGLIEALLGIWVLTTRRALISLVAVVPSPKPPSLGACER